MESLQAVCHVLRHRNRPDLAVRLENASVEFDVTDTYGSLFRSLVTTAEIYAPISDYECLKSLRPADQQAILDAVLEIWPPRSDDIEITGVIFRLDSSSLGDSTEDHTELVQEIDRLRETLISVATGGPRIQDVNHKYKARYAYIDRELRELKLQNPIPYATLWDWYGKWSSGDLPTYRSRREYIRGLLEPLDQRLRNGAGCTVCDLFQEPTGWHRVDRSIGEIRKRLQDATTEEQFQAVGLICRETMISLAQAVYDPVRHPSPDGTTPSETDAKRMLEAYITRELSASANDYARKHTKAAFDLANHLQHRRTATFRTAALCAEAISSVVNIIAIVSGQRDPD